MFNCDILLFDEVRLPTCIVLLSAMNRQLVIEFRPEAVIRHC